MLLQDKKYIRTPEAEKKKNQGNILNEYRCEYFQQNSRQPNSTAYQEDHTSGSSGFYPWNASIISHGQINVYNIAHKQNKG